MLDCPLRRLGLLLCLASALIPISALAQPSAARIWNEELLAAIQRDEPQASIHARNLFHLSIALWDAWAAYDPNAKPYLYDEKLTASDANTARSEAMSFAAYRILRARFNHATGMAESFIAFDAAMDDLGYDRSIVSTAGNSPAALGNRIAAAVLEFGLEDGANEQNGYTPTYGYMPVNGPMVVAMPGTMMTDPNRWQPLALVLLKQSGGSDKMDPVLGPYARHLTPHWTAVTPFALRESDRTPNTHFDPGAPPHLGGEGSEELIENVVHLIEMSGHLDPDDGAIIDISPGARGNAALGDYDGAGHALNPATGTGADS
jgi:hypothetical protein